jgi:hypothetical protein
MAVYQPLVAMYKAINTSEHFHACLLVHVGEGLVVLSDFTILASAV